MHIYVFHGIQKNTPVLYFPEVICLIPAKSRIPFTFFHEARLLQEINKLQYSVFQIPESAPELHPADAIKIIYPAGHIRRNKQKSRSPEGNQLLSIVYSTVFKLLKAVTEDQL